MRGNFISWLVLWVAAGLALQPAKAGGRKDAATDRAGAATHHLIVATQARSLGDNHEAITMKLQGRGDLPFSPITPFESRSARPDDQAVTRERDQKEKGSAPRPERKTITLIRFDSKLGNVSVQPVVGGVNGAQLSVGF
jgi:hypothetical protein